MQRGLETRLADVDARAEHEPFSSTGTGVGGVKPPKFHGSTCSTAILRLWQWTTGCNTKRIHVPACHPAGLGCQGSTWCLYRSNIWGDYWGIWRLLWGPPPGCRVPLSAENKVPTLWWVPAVVCHCQWTVHSLRPSWNTWGPCLQEAGKEFFDRIRDQGIK
jgi:hypothetical protein